MILYHGSIETIENPKMLEQQRLLDFGNGFYLTSSVEQAERWALIKMKRSNDISHGYDIVTGPVANDTLYQTLTLFETGILTKPETIARLKVHRLFDQFSFHSQRAIAYLNFKEAYIKAENGKPFQ